MMKIEPLGYRIMLKPKDMEEVSKGGIVIPQTTVDRNKAATNEGTVVALGPDAYKEFDTPWVEIGDEVLYSKYNGERLINPKTKEEVIMINDTDILCKWREE
jgi:chaperonin GroES